MWNIEVEVITHNSWRSTKSCQPKHGYISRSDVELIGENEDLFDEETKLAGEAYAVHLSSLHDLHTNIGTLVQGSCCEHGKRCSNTSPEEDAITGKGVGVRL